MLNGKPFYIGLGIHKSATTWIYACLYEHPAICIPHKDVHFFYRDDLFQKGYAWYEHSIIQHYKKETVLADFSVVNLVGDACASRIKRRYPEAKLFACLRNPVDRAWSHYLQDIKKGHIPEHRSFEEAIAMDDRYILFGRYKQHLENYLSHFSGDQLKVFLYDDIEDDPALFIKNLYTYMTVDDTFVPKYLDQKPNSAMLNRFAWVDRVNTKISESLKTSKIGQKLWWKIKTSGLPSGIRRLNAAPAKNEASIKKEFLNDLHKVFEEDIIFVKQYLNRKDLSW